MTVDADRRELELLRVELLAERKAAILYGVDLPVAELDIDLLDLSVQTLHVLLGYVLDPLSIDIIHHQNLTIINGDDADLVLAPRGGGKSTTGTVVRSIWYAVRDFNVRILLGSETEGAGKKFLDEIKTHLVSNSDLIEMFGTFAPLTTDVKRKWGESRATIRQRTRAIGEPTFTCLGIGGQGASRHFEKIFLDDIVTLKYSRTKAQRKALDDWYGSTLQGTFLSNTICHHLGTRYYPGDQWEVLENGRADEPSGPVHGRVLRIQAIQNDADGNEVSFSPDRFSIAYLKRRLLGMGRAHFAAQMQQDTSLMEGEIWSFADFQWYDETEREMRIEVSGWPTFVYFDLKGKKQDVGDYFAAIAIAVSPDKNKIYVLDVDRFRGGMRRQRRAIKSWVKRWTPVYAGIEANNMQTAFAQEIRDYSLLPVTPREAKKDKYTEGQMVAPLSEAGKIWMPLRSDAETERPAGDRVHVLTEELVAFPNADHDDCVDAYVGALLGAIYGDWDDDPGEGYASGDRDALGI